MGATPNAPLHCLTFGQPSETGLQLPEAETVRTKPSEPTDSGRTSGHQKLFLNYGSPPPRRRRVKAVPPPLSLQALGGIERLKKRNYFISHDLPSRIEEKENEESHFTTEHLLSQKDILDYSPNPRKHHTHALATDSLQNADGDSRMSRFRPRIRKLFNINSTREPFSTSLESVALKFCTGSSSSSRNHTASFSQASKNHGHHSGVTVRIFRNYNRVNLLDTFAPGKLIQTAISQKKTNRPLPLKQLSKPSEEPPSPLRKKSVLVKDDDEFDNILTPEFSGCEISYKQNSHSSKSTPRSACSNRSVKSGTKVKLAVAPEKRLHRRSMFARQRHSLESSVFGPIHNLNTTLVHHVELITPKKSRRDLGCKIEGLRTKIEHYILLKSIGRGGWAEDIYLVVDTRNKMKYVASLDQAAKVLNVGKLAVNVERNKLLGLIKSEILVMRTLVAHKHIVRLHEVLEDEESDKIYLILDFCSKGAVLSSSFWKAEEAYQGMNKREKQFLFGLNNCLPIEKAVKYMRQSAGAIEYSSLQSCSALRSEHHPSRHQARQPVGELHGRNKGY
jgi:hypothetical protein